MKDTILVLTTGGTIDDLEYDDERNAPTHRPSLIPSLLKKSGFSGLFDIEEMMLKDSQFVTDADRMKILSRILQSTESRILVTHGTKTMAQTAKFLGPHIQGKTVVLTGCMTLPSDDHGNDAMSSLTFAIESLENLPPGVFVAMQEKIFPWDNVRKNIEARRFETEQ